LKPTPEHPETLITPEGMKTKEGRDDEDEVEGDRDDEDDEAKSEDEEDDD
jgi:hypothetical protein